MGNADLKWAHLMGTETEADFDSYFEYSSTGHVEIPYNTAPYVRTYEGAAGDRRSVRMTTTSGNAVWVGLPEIARTAFGTAGAVGFSMYLDKTLTPPTSGTPLATYTGNFGDTVSVYYGASWTTVTIRLDGLFQAVSSAFDMRTWNWFGFYGDYSTTTFKAKLQVNGVEIIAEQTRGSLTAQTSTTSIRFFGATNNYFTEWALFDNYAATVPVLWVDRYEPTADGTDSGSWTPSAGTVNYAVLDSPYDDGATYTTEATPASGEYVEVNSASDIATQLGVTPTTIYAVIGVVAGQGDTASIDMRISDDGITFDTGASLALDGTTDFTYVASPDRPSSGADWTGTDTITTRIQVP